MTFKLLSLALAAYSIISAAGSALTPRDGAICLSSSNSAPTSDVYANIKTVCGNADGTVLAAGAQSSAITRVSTGDLSIIITNNAASASTIDSLTCQYDLNVVVASCSAIANSFAHGKITQGDFTYEIQVLGNNGGGLIESRTVSNNSNCFPGNASAPATEIMDIVQDSLCKIFTNATLVPKESYRFDYWITEGDLVFEMLNVCNTTVKLDNETCYCGFDKLIEQCVDPSARFINGTIDNECIRLNGWVNNTRILNAPAQSKRSTASPVSLYERQDAFSCPPGVSSPYTVNIIEDANLAVFEYCAGYVGQTFPANVNIQQDIPLATTPQYGPASFDFTNTCNQAITWNAAQCENDLLATINSTYYACEFISGTAVVDGCQSMSYTVGL